MLERVVLVPSKKKQNKEKQPRPHSEQKSIIKIKIESNDYLRPRERFSLPYSATFSSRKNNPECKEGDLVYATFFQLARFYS